MTKRTPEYERQTTATKKKARPSLAPERRKPQKRKRPVETAATVNPPVRKSVREKDSVRRRTVAAGEPQKARPKKPLPTKASKKKSSTLQSSSDAIHKKKLQQRNPQLTEPKKVRPKRKKVNQAVSTGPAVSKKATPGQELSTNGKPKPTRTEIHAKKQASQPRSKLKKGLIVVYHLLMSCLLLVLLALGSAFVLFRTETALFHYQLIGVADNSMAIKEQANIHSGDLIVVKQQSFNQFKEADIITFRDSISKQYMTRRVTGFQVDGDQKYVVVQGDVQAFPSEAVASKQIVGKVSTRFAKLASVFGFVQENLFLVLAFCTTFIILLILLRVFLIH